jgi:glycolate oxidase FAD binding subunit
MTSAATLDAVRAALPADRYLDPASRDRDGEFGYSIARVGLPSIAVRPQTAEEVAAVLAAARAAGAAVVPLGAHTAMTLGRPLERYDIALDMLGLDRIIEYEPADLTVTVEAGMTLRALQDRLREHGQYLPVDPPPDDQVTIGGMLATARSGAWRGHLPAARDLILGVTVALPDGTLTTSGGRVVKNVTGYDLQRLHTGALGALGVIVSASFKVSPLPEATSTLGVRCADLASAERVAFEVWDRGLPLRALTIVDTRTAGALALPAAYFVITEAAGVPAVTERAGREVAAIANASGAELFDLERRSRPRLLASNESTQAAHPAAQHWFWNALRRHTDRDDWRDWVSLRLGVPPSEVRATLEAVAAAGLEGWAHLAAGSVLAVGECVPVRTVEAPSERPSQGGGSFAPLQGGTARPLIEDPAGVIEALRAHASKVGGFLQVESAPGTLDGHIDPFGAGDIELTRALKARFDPTGALNPGRWAEGV